MPKLNTQVQAAAPLGHHCICKHRLQQDLPGVQKKMEPQPVDTLLETASGPKPYTGVGKLRGKKALITGGE